MKIKLFGNNVYITRLGIESNEVCWVFPWKRSSKTAIWFSYNFDCFFPSFKDYKKLEDNYTRDLWKIHRFSRWNDYENYPDGEQ